jgi:hypothetical protein
MFRYIRAIAWIEKDGYHIVSGPSVASVDEPSGRKTGRGGLDVDSMPVESRR